MVDGCKADLRKCRDYHRWHKVCDVHSKVPMAIVLGRPMRFCQQCSRFHTLEEFDEAKRSCRRRLAGHNQRRRLLPYNLNSGSSGGVSTTVGFTCSNMESKQLNPVLVPVLDDHEMRNLSMIHVYGERSSDGTSPFLPSSHNSN